MDLLADATSLSHYRSHRQSTERICVLSVDGPGRRSAGPQPCRLAGGDSQCGGARSGTQRRRFGNLGAVARPRIKMATGKKYPRARGHPTRQTRIRASLCARGHRRGHTVVPSGQRYTGKRIPCPHPQIRQTRTDKWGHLKRYIFFKLGFLSPKLPSPAAD